MEKGRMYMSNNELNRLEVLTKVKEKRLKQSKAAKILGISPRQLRRLMRRFREEGPKGVISRKYGAPSNHQLSLEVKERVVNFAQKEEHRDFGPTLTHEYLVNGTGLEISISSVRNIMLLNRLWDSKEVRDKRVHKLRPRRPREGELIQIDGSPHDWLEGRGPMCTLLVFIDDATSKTMLLKFAKSESIVSYFLATREYMEKYGRPEAFYSDKHSVFRVNREGALSGDGMTQFGRVMDELDIRLICANSPQAKGRVERRNRDFQNRLIKAMRLHKISTIEDANAFLPSFLEEFNRKFAKTPQDPTNAHRPLLDTHDLDKIFCFKETRKLSKNLTLQYDNVIYQVVLPRREYLIRKAEVTVMETLEGEITIEHRGKKLCAVPHHKMQARAEEVSAKELIEKLGSKYRPRPGKMHPWKRGRKGFSIKLACNE